MDRLQVSVTGALHVVAKAWTVKMGSMLAAPHRWLMSKIAGAASRAVDATPTKYSMPIVPSYGKAMESRTLTVAQLPPPSL